MRNLCLSEFQVCPERWGGWYDGYHRHLSQVTGRGSKLQVVVSVVQSTVNCQLFKPTFRRAGSFRLPKWEVTPICPTQQDRRDL
jgi:hypothetical protein